MTLSAPAVDHARQRLSEGELLAGQVDAGLEDVAGGDRLGRDEDVVGQAAVSVVAKGVLGGAHVLQPVLALPAAPARDHRCDRHGLAGVVALDAPAGLGDVARDLVAEDRARVDP
jgi:hypothetical protein